MLLNFYYYKKELEYGWYLGCKKGNTIARSPKLFTNKTKCLRDAKQARESLIESTIIVGTIKKGRL